MKPARKPNQSKQTYINLNYKGRKAVINLSLKQLTDIVGTDIDIEDYKHVLDKNYFLEYPKQLKAKVLLEHEYLQLVETADAYQDAIAEIEIIKKNIDGLNNKLVASETEAGHLQEQLKHKNETIAMLRKKLHDNEILLSKVKTSIEHIERDNNSLKNDIEKLIKKYDSLKYTSLMESINNERDYEKLAYELQSYSWFDMVFTNKKKKWVNKFLDKLHLQELKRNRSEIDGETNQDDKQ